MKELSGKWDAWNKDVKALEGYQAFANSEGAKVKGRKRREEED